MLLQDLYNRVLGFFRQTDEEKESTKDVACNRLRVVLMQDRTNLTPELLERMRGELVELLSKYLEMDKEALELNLEQDGEQVALMLSIPVIRAKDEEEIKAALAEADKAKEEEEIDAENDAEEVESEEADDEEETKESNEVADTVDEEDTVENEQEEEKLQENTSSDK